MFLSSSSDTAGEGVEVEFSSSDSNPFLDTNESSKCQREHGTCLDHQKDTSVWMPNTIFGGTSRQHQQQQQQQQHPALSLAARFRRNHHHTIELRKSPSQATRNTQQIQEEMESTAMLRCPCYEHDSFASDAVEVVATAKPTSHHHHHRAPSRERSLLTAAESLDEDDTSSQYVADHLTGVLENGDEYVIHTIVVEGSLHKKGTGKDLFGSKGWKNRWARLALGRVEGYGDAVDVPLFCVSWYRNSALCSNVIVLDGMVVMKSDLAQGHKWNRHRFDIQHATAAASNNPTTPATRSFTAPSQKARDAWVYAISQELLSFEKQKAAAAAAYAPASRSAEPSFPLFAVPADENDRKNQRLTVEDGWVRTTSPPSSSGRAPPSSPVLPQSFPNLPRSPVTRKSTKAGRGKERAPK